MHFSRRGLTRCLGKPDHERMEVIMERRPGEEEKKKRAQTETERRGEQRMQRAKERLKWSCFLFQNNPLPYRHPPKARSVPRSEWEEQQ